MRPSLPATLVLLLAAAPVGAAELDLGWTADGVWSSNVYRTPDATQPINTGSQTLTVKIPKEADFSIRTGPNLELREKQGDLRYDLDYQLRYEEFARLDGLSEFDHFANASADWAITDLTTVSLSDNFGYSSSIGALYDALGAVALNESIVLRSVRQRITSNLASGSVRHRLGRLWELNVSGDNQMTDYGSLDNSQSRSFAGTVQLTRGFTRRLVLGFGGQVTRQESSSDLASTDSGSTFAQAFGIANYEISRTLHVKLSAGPALSIPDGVSANSIDIPEFVAVDTSTCPTQSNGDSFVPLGQSLAQVPFAPQQVKGCLPVGITLPNGDVGIAVSAPTNKSVKFVGDTGIQNSLTYFARLELEKEWRNLRASFAYNRSATNSSGLGTSTFVDSVSSQLTWIPSSRWTISLRGSLSKQSAISEVRAQEVVVDPGAACEDRVFVPDSNGGHFAQVPQDLQCQMLNLPGAAIPVGIPRLVTSGDKISNPIDVKTYRFELSGQRRISRSLSARASASWYQQTNTNVLQDNKRSEYRVLLGMTWQFDPIPL